MIPNNLTVEDCTISPYHNGNGWRKPGTNKRKPQSDMPHDFILWDGEGITYTEGQPQDYVLFGCYDGRDHSLVTSESLTTDDCLSLIIDVGRSHPSAWHVAFAFDYDVTMIVKRMPKRVIEILDHTNHCRYGEYRIEYIRHKWFRVSKENATVTIYDTWGFFQSSLVAALKSYIPTHPLMTHLPEIEEGKGKRGSFTFEDMAYIEKYWRIENELGHALVCQLKEYLYEVDLRITKWHGPGAIASHVYKSQGIHTHRVEAGELLYNASRYGYAGGRFEVFRVGRHLDAYSYDINSAYPEAISLLPSLSEGFWHYREGQPRETAYFGIYHIRTNVPENENLRKATLTPAPLFHRHRRGQITFQHFTEGWYWSPEIQAMQDTGYPFEIIEGWEYFGWGTRPFTFVQDMYEQRREMKAKGIGSQIAIKLALNSLYGKMAQRAGWERNGKAPAWHQLEWAGWVTSYTRAKLYRLIHRIPWDDLIAVETDGLYCTSSPDVLGISDSKQLGGWEVNHYDEMVYLQSGVYAKRCDSDWSVKYRGLDRGSLTAAQIVDHSRILLANDPYWYPITGTTTRFVGMKNALFRQKHLHQGPAQLHMGKWEVDKREISIGSEGKRKHNPKLCQACSLGLSAYDMPHDLAIKSHPGLRSEMHDIPWLEGDPANWRDIQEIEEEIITLGTDIPWN